MNLTILPTSDLLARRARIARQLDVLHPVDDRCAWRRLLAESDALASEIARRNVRVAVSA